jgi:hypothetical protein
LQARLLRSRGIRYVALTKSGLLMDVVRAEARTIRKKVGTAPFMFPILEGHLKRAYRAGQSTKSPKTIRHGVSSSALGGVGAVRFALSISGDNLNIVEMSLYDFDAFGGLVRTGESLESYLARRDGQDPSKLNNYPAVYSWDVLPHVQDRDWEQHIIPTLEEIVYSAYTDTELGIYPRALADVHNRVKLRFADPELETQRRRIITDLARAGVPVEDINITPDEPHKTDPDMKIQTLTELPPQDIIVEAKDDKVTVELDVRNNAEVRVGDQYTAQWPDGAMTVLRVISFESAADYSPTIARRADAMREGVTGPPNTITARKEYQIKLAIMRVEGELKPDGNRIVGPTRLPDVMLPVYRISDDDLEKFAVNQDGNLLLGNLRSGGRTLSRAARLLHIYSGERMVVLGNTGMGKSQFTRALLSQAMAEGTEDFQQEGDRDEQE